MTLLGLSLALAAHAAPRSGPEVTVYNQGFALVKELRSFHLKQGRQSIEVTDVAAQIDPSSVAMRDLTDPNGFSVLEQNYQYDLISPQAILNKSVGGHVRLIRHFGNQAETLEGTLISSPNAVVNNGVQGGYASQTYNGMVIRTDDGRIILDPVGEVEVTSVPAGLISKPTLMWDLEAAKSGSNDVELSYITNGMSWNADYVFTLDEALGKGSLKGWVTMNNQSGATYRDALLKLLAGNVHQVVQPRARREVMDGAVYKAENAPAFQEQQLFEYHLYTLQRPATIRNNETKQLSLLEGNGVPFRKRLIVDSFRDFGVYYPQQDGEAGSGTTHAQVKVEFKNDEASNLGMPLPAGRVRLYQRDAGGSVQLLGEDRIDHTPRNETVSLLVGEAFDVVSNRKRLDFHWLGARQVSETFEIDVRNRKQTTETVEVWERHYGDWSVGKASEKFTKQDANSMLFLVTLKPNEERKITYTVTTKW